MDMSDFRPESHVAQRSRRDKLRVHQNSNNPSHDHHLGEYTNNLEQLSHVHQGLNSGIVQDVSFRYASTTYEGSIYSSDMLNFAASSQMLAHHQDESTTDKAQNCGNWRSTVGAGSQQSCDWNNIVNQNPMFVGGDGALSSSPSLKPNNVSTYGDYHNAPTSGDQISSSSNQHQFEEMQYSSPIYHNALQEVVIPTATKGLEMASFGETKPNSWGDSGNELLLLPNYGNQSNSLCVDQSYGRVDRRTEGCYQWSTGEVDFEANKGRVGNESNTQGLSLSLSSVPSTKRHAYDNLSDSRSLNSESLMNTEQSIGGAVFGNTRQDVVGTSSFAHRATGPLGPFTGYATILKNSRFLKPAQQLLDEFCGVIGPRFARTSETSSNKNSDKVCAYPVNAIESVDGAKGMDSGPSSSTFRSSNEISGGGTGGVGRSSVETFQPEYQQQKAKLLYMHEEVCRRYKQYHQQMQMVVSSFETVAGLSAATPYISLALKTVSRHFQCLKNAISDQLGHIRKALGEDLSPPKTGTSSCKGDNNTIMSRLNFVDQSGFQKQKSGSRGGGGTVGFFESQHHVWRPQRGLPERAVAILRAWLFDHFLHPYPTDTDKHMLATQTGLSRNQVSNWFINARVRVWKPMVEEIHTLETKGLAEANSNVPIEFDGEPSAECSTQPNNYQLTSMLGMNHVSNKQAGYSGAGSDGNNAELWNQDKRSRTECESTHPDCTTIGGSLANYMPSYQGGGLEIGGLGAVSLTLGLRQSAEGAQQQQQQQQEQRLRQHFGGQMIHDFVG